MTKIDRYILVLFARTILICFSSIGGVFVVFHAFTNLEDLQRLTDSGGSALLTLLRFYGPYMLMLFDWTAAIIALMSMLFTVSWLRRTGELTSLLAAGIRHGRVIRPMLLTVAMVIAVQCLCREFMIPQYRDLLSAKPGEWKNAKAQAMLPSYDKSAGILIEGEGLFPDEARIERPTFRLYSAFPGFGDLIEAKSAKWQPSRGDRPAGYLVDSIKRPSGIDGLVSGRVNDRPILITRREADWVGPNQCFVVTSLDIEILKDNPRSTRMAGILELVRRVRNGSVHSSKDLHTLLHDRILRPPLDFCLVLLGLPLVVNRGDKRLFSVIGQAIGIVLLFFAIKTAAAAMAASGVWFSPAMAAWTPLLVLGPIAFVRYRDAQEQ